MKTFNREQIKLSHNSISLAGIIQSSPRAKQVFRKGKKISSIDYIPRKVAEKGITEK